MAEQADSSGSLALSRRPRDAAHTHPRTISGSPPFSAASVPTRRPAQPAEIAQARVFERILQAEGAELQELADRIVGDSDQQPGPGKSRASEDLAQLHARIDEVHGLLRTLRRRFPHSAPDGDR